MRPRRDAEFLLVACLILLALLTCGIVYQAQTLERQRLLIRQLYQDVHMCQGFQRKCT